MEVLSIVAVIAGIGGIGYLSLEVHKYSLINYGRTPFNKQNGIVTFVLAILFVALWFYIPEEHTIGTFFVSIIQFDVPQNGQNALVIMVLVILGLLGIGWKITRDTNLWIGAYSTLVMFMVSVIVLIILIAIWLWRENEKAERKKRR